MAAISSLTVVCFCLIAQMVGAGQLIKLLFGLDYNVAIFAVGILMMVLRHPSGGMVCHNLGADHQGLHVAWRRYAGHGAAMSNSAFASNLLLERRRRS